MGDIKVVRLGTRSRRCGAERGLGILFATSDQRMIVAHADNLHRGVEGPFEVPDDRWPKFDGPLLPHDVRRIEIADKPVIAAIDPDIYTVLQDNPQGPPSDFRGQ